MKNFLITFLVLIILIPPIMKPVFATAILETEPSIQNMIEEYNGEYEARFSALKLEIESEISEVREIAEDHSAQVDVLSNAVTVGPIIEPGATGCNVIAEGRLPNQEGVNGLLGAPWALCDDGLLEVGEGFINNSSGGRPWASYGSRINQIIFTGPITAGESLSGLFSLGNVTTIEGLEHFDTSQVTNMAGMFGNAHSLKSLNLSTWNTSNVTDMSWMFWSASSLTDLDISNFDTSQVTNMEGMLAEASSLTSLDLSNFRTRKVTDMHWMFTNARSLISLDLSNFDTKNVTDMHWMFAFVSALTSLDVSNWDTRNVTNMNGMFGAASALTSLDVSNWDTSNVTDMRSTFNSVYSLTSLDVSNWDTSSVTDFSLMFFNANRLTSLDLSNWDISSITNELGMDWMFLNTNSLSKLTLGSRFRFIGSPGLPEILPTAEFTGYWQNVGDGTVSNPTGEFVFTSAS